MSQIAKNPYHPSNQEAEYLSWEHGHTAKTKDECPYTKEDEPRLFDVWQKGFRSNKSRPKPVVVKEVESEAENEPSEELEVSAGVDVAQLPTNLLEAELKRRKIKELQALAARYDKLMDEIQKVTKEIQRLKVLTGD